VPIIFITANDDEAIRARALARGAKGFISKPFDDRVLLDLIVAARGTPAKVPSPGLRLQVSGKVAQPAKEPIHDGLEGETPDIVDFELTELLPCPFCGDRAGLTQGTWTDDRHQDRYWAAVTCPRCGATLLTGKDAPAMNLHAAREAVMAQWNCRTTAAPRTPDRLGAGPALQPPAVTPPAWKKSPSRSIWRK
jgi:CheY-like chemotaxis protein